jgi:glycosyltransferase involved in cell wall biosynthesis
VEDLHYGDSGYLNRAQADQEYSAVTGACLLVRKSLYEEAGGLDEQEFKVSFNDIDLCLKVRQHGHRVIWTPFATLLHHGSATQKSRTRNPSKIAAVQNEYNHFYLRWQKVLINDPAWNRNLSLAFTSPVIEDELAIPWNPDFHDRPRVTAMPIISDGAAEYRCIAPLRALHARGKIHYAAVCQPRPGFERAPIPVELARMAPDTLLMHAPVDNVRCQALLVCQRFNPDILRVYTLDDLITDIPSDNPFHYKLPAEVMKERLMLGLKASHRLIVSTEPLAEACRQWIDDIRIVPNTLDGSIWGKLKSRRRRGPRLRVGWAGAQQHAGDLRLLRDVVAATRREVDWVFFGMLPEETRPLVAEFHDYLHDFTAYPEKLASLDLDLALAPLIIHPFNEAKSNLRLLEYGALGWPVICTDIFPYRTDDPPVTRLSNDAEKWIAAIRERVADPDALAREGDALRAWVEKHYLLENRLDQWFEALTR